MLEVALLNTWEGMMVFKAPIQTFLNRYTISIFVRSMMPCQPTASQRRRPELGKSSAPVPMGRPAKVKRTHEHGYFRNNRKKRKAPNSLAYAIENDQAVGKNYSTKISYYDLLFYFSLS